MLVRLGGVDIIRGRDCVAIETSGRRTVRDRRDVSQLTVVSATNVLDRRFVPRRSPLAEPDRQHGGGGEQSGSDPRSGAALLMFVRTDAHARQKCNYAVLAVLSR